MRVYTLSTGSLSFPPLNTHLLRAPVPPTPFRRPEPLAGGGERAHCSSCRQVRTVTHGGRSAVKKGGVSPWCLLNRSRVARWGQDKPLWDLHAHGLAQGPCHWASPFCSHHTCTGSTAPWIKTCVMRCLDSCPPAGPPAKLLRQSELKCERLEPCAAPVPSAPSPVNIKAARLSKLHVWGTKGRHGHRVLAL